MSGIRRTKCAALVLLSVLTFESAPGSVPAQDQPEKVCEPGKVNVDGKCVTPRPKLPKAQTPEEAAPANPGRPVPPLIPRCKVGETLKDGVCTPAG
jgi:hypothetical protein